MPSGTSLSMFAGVVLEVAVRGAVLSSRRPSPCRGSDLYWRPWYRNTSPGAFFRAGEHAAHHHGVRAGGERLGDVARETHAAVCDHRHAAAPAALQTRSTIAVICGTPTPATIRVVQIEPGPMPTFTPSAPYSTSALAAAAVAMLPPITSTCGKFCLTQRTRSSTPLAVAVRGVDDDHVDAAACQQLRRALRCPGPTPTAAPARSLPCSSLQASGCFGLLRDVLHRHQAAQLEVASLITSTRSRRWLCISAFASASDVPSLTVTRRSRGVMMLRTGSSRRSLETQVAVGDDTDQLRAVHHREAEIPCCCEQRR